MSYVKVTKRWSNGSKEEVITEEVVFDENNLHHQIAKKDWEIKELKKDYRDQLEFLSGKLEALEDRKPRWGWKK